MKRNKRFIWLDPNLYPEYVKNDESGKFAIAEFKRIYESPLPLEIEITADARYMLFVNGEYIGRGPTSVGSDFLNGKMEYPYYERYNIGTVGKAEIRVLVTTVSTALTEYTFGSCGLWVNVNAMGLRIGQTDESWDARLLSERKDVFFTDYDEKEHPYHKAKLTNTPLDIIPSPIDQLDEEKIYPTNFEKIVVEPRKSHTVCLNFDKIYSAYPYFSLKCNGKCTIKMTSTENGEAGRIEEKIVSSKDVIHFSPRMRSIGEIELEIVNESDEIAVIDDFYIDFIHYPVYVNTSFKCSDPLLNQIYDVCMHTLKICRQTIHLDSPTHQELLACTGDYYIQSLIEYLNMYDPTLAKWDIKRTSNILNIQDGRLFHTSYSLIYPWWVYDHYMFTGDKEVISKTSLNLLLNRFEGYISKENGLIEYSPDYMFVDWVVVSTSKDEFLDGGNMMSHGEMEGYSLHHPPKALGQSVLCMFYYNALLKISELYKLVNEEKIADKCLKRAEELKESINKHLFDKSKGLYVGGLNTDNLVEESQWLPKNTKTVYYLKQANTLAVLFGIAPKDKCKDILKYVVTGLNKYEMQPYFYHFLLEALYKEDMLEEYGLELIRRYKNLIEKCPKGLSEAWENMKCDFSHAWGATPAYILKKALSGIEILEPAYRKIKLNPQLYGLTFAEFEISTPYGNIEISMKKGEEVLIKAPKEIQIVK